MCLPKSRFLSQQLMLRAAMGTLLGHDFGAALARPDAPHMGAFAAALVFARACASVAVADVSEQAMTKRPA